MQACDSIPPINNILEQKSQIFVHKDACHSLLTFNANQIQFIYKCTNHTVMPDLKTLNLNSLIL